MPNKETFSSSVCIPVVDAPQCFLKLAQYFWGCRPLDMSAIVLHRPDVFEAAVDLADVGLDFVAPIGPQDDKGCSHTTIPHSGNGSPPDLEEAGEEYVSW